MAPRRRIEGTVQDEARMLMAMHPDWSPVQVYRAVNRLHQIEVDDLQARTPVISLRTIQRLFQAATSDDSGPWDLNEGAPEDIPLVLEVVRHLSDSGSKSPFPSKVQGRLIARLRRAYWDLPVPLSRWLAVFGSDDSPAGIRRVEMYLAFAPWRDHEGALQKAVKRGLVADDVLALAVILRPIGMGHEDWLEEEGYAQQ
jgi:hypothetical protein